MEKILFLELYNSSVSSIVNIITDNYLRDSSNDDDDYPLIELISRDNKIKCKPKIHLNKIENLSDINFKGHFRLTRTNVELIIQVIGPQFFTGKEKRKGSVETFVLLSVWYFTNLEGYRDLSVRFDVALSKVYSLILEFSSFLTNKKDDLISWPVGGEVDRTADRFSQRTSFPGVIGCIGGARIRVLSPNFKMKSSPSWRHRKQIASVVIQGVCNSKLEFINVYVGCPGSSNGVNVFHQSPLGIELSENPSSLVPSSHHILGDSSYPLSNVLLTPYWDNGRLELSQKRYNTLLTSTRLVIEQTFGKLFGRFKRLRSLDVHRTEKCSLFITTACILHNICISANDDINVDEYEDVRTNADRQVESQDGIDKRNVICKYLQNRC